MSRQQINKRQLSTDLSSPSTPKRIRGASLDPNTPTPSLQIPHRASPRVPRSNDASSPIRPTAGLFSDISAFTELDDPKFVDIPHSSDETVSPSSPSNPNFNTPSSANLITQRPSTSDAEAFLDRPNAVEVLVAILEALAANDWAHRKARAFWRLMGHHKHKTLRSSLITNDHLFALNELNWGIPQMQEEFKTFRKEAWSGTFNQATTGLSDIISPSHGNPRKHCQIRPPRLNTMAVIGKLWKKAPHIAQLFKALSGRADDAKLFKKPVRIFAICAILIYTGYPKRHNTVQHILSTYWRAAGANKRTLSHLNQLGLCVSTSTNLRSTHKLEERSRARIKAIGHQPGVVTAIDNIDISRSVRERRVLDNKELLHFTSGFCSIGINIPPNGLKKSMLHANSALSPEYIFAGPGWTCHSHLESLSMATILDAITAAVPAIAKRKDSSLKLSHWIPNLSRLPVQKSTYNPLQTIDANAGTSDGLLQAIEHVFTSQYGHNPDSTKRWTDSLYLLYGDQKTASLIRNLKRRRAQSQFSFHQLDWLLELPSTFHMRQNFLQFICRTHFHNTAVTHPIALVHSKILIGAKQIQDDAARTEFYALQEFLLLVLHGYIFAEVQQIYYQQHCQQLPEASTAHEGHNVALWVQGLPTSALLNLMGTVFTNLFKDEVYPSNNPDRANFLQFIHLMRDYQHLYWAERYADTELFHLWLDRACLFYSARKQSNYALELLRLKWLIGTPAADSELQQAILSNLFINTVGESGAWKGVDLMVEHLNRDIKSVHTDRHRGAIDQQVLLNYASLQSVFIHELRQALDDDLHIFISGAHTTKSTQSTVIVIANRTAGYFKDQTSVPEPLSFENLLELGTQKLSDAVIRFNRQRMHEDPIEEEDLLSSLDPVIGVELQPAAEDGDDIP